MKARNAAGLSPLSNTVTATVPASETEEETVPASEGEEEELVASQQSHELFLVSNLDTSGLGFQIGQQQPITARYAQSFSAANNADGATAEFDFYGITVVIGLPSEEVTQIPGNDLVVTLNSDESGRPGNLVYTLTSPPTIATSEIGSRFTFTAPPGSTLSSGVTYWLKIETAADSTYFDRNYALWYFTSDESEVQGPATENRWSIADTSLKSPQVLLWRTAQRSMKMAVHGLQRLGPLVSNLGQLDDDLAIIGTNLQAAQSFVAGPDPAGFGYRFQGIRVAASSHVLGGDVLVPEVRVSLHRDVNGLPPGSRLLTLTVPHDFASTGEFIEYALSAPPGTVIPGGARYWVVFETLSETLLLRTTSSPDEDQVPPPVDGWLIDNERYLKDINNVWQRPPRVIEMAVLGSPEWVTDEPAGGDFPGADYNGQETTGVVIPGTVSTGQLTTGLDRNHGHTGDYWYLDTEAGRSYRVEVTFGNNPGITTGGSAWNAFVDPDRDEYPDATSCCDSDHNRDDGATFLHFTHSNQSREKNRRYMVKVAAFDLYNTGTAVYNGPYEITLTDITGVKQMVNAYSRGTTTASSLLVDPPDGNSVDLAFRFRTGAHTDGYTLDRIKVRFHDIRDAGAIPEIAIHEDTSDAPGTKVCDLAVPDRIVESAVNWSTPPPHTFLAPDCADFTLTADTPYWIVFSDMDHVEYELEVADTPDVRDYGSGWTLLNAAIKRGGSNTWIGDPSTLRVGLWAKERRPAEGDPLARGERKVGATLTADTGGITDPDGLTDPMFEYQWQRVDGGTPADITGAMSDTYTLTDDDVGKRIQLRTRFRDDSNSQETLTGPATSLIVPEPRLLVSNYSQPVMAADFVDSSSGFVTGTHSLGYTIHSITMERSSNTSAPSVSGEFRLYTSTLTADPINALPDDRIMTVSGPDRVNGYYLTFGAPSRVKLNPSTVYHTVLTATSGRRMGCAAATAGTDSNSLADFSVISRIHEYPSNGLYTANVSCKFRIDGFELMSSSFVESVEFTSSPEQPGMYATGQVIEATATLSEAVAFDGPPPALLLQVGDNEREMEYAASASTATSWVFRYRVTADDRDDDGVSFERNALQGYADADLSHPPTRDDRERHVNAVPRVVSRRVSSSSVAPTWYGPGEQIQFTVEFSLPVTVVGDPQLEFSVTMPGPQNEFASYLSGSGARELVFSYTVRTGDDDADGIWLDANSLRLDSNDSITGVYNGLNAVLDHTALNLLAGHRIDQNPRAVSQEVTSDPTDGTDSDTYGAGDAITFAVKFNQAVTVTGAPRLRFSVTGPGDEYATYVSGSGSDTLVFSYTVLATETDPDGIYLYDTPLDYLDAAADSIVGAANNLPAVNEISGQERRLPGHKIDGAITN